MDGILNDIPPEIVKSITEMKVAKLYNDYTGANVSHFELRQLSVMEFEQIVSSITAWGIIDDVANYKLTRDKKDQ